MRLMIGEGPLRATLDVTFRHGRNAEAGDHGQRASVPAIPGRFNTASGGHDTRAAGNDVWTVWKQLSWGVSP